MAPRVEVQALQSLIWSLSGEGSARLQRGECDERLSLFEMKSEDLSTIVRLFFSRDFFFSFCLLASSL